MLPEDVPPRVKKHKIRDVLPTIPNLAPSASIPVGPLGYAPPGPTYLGRNNTLVSLDFLDENRLLFTFRAPGLLHRDAGDVSSDQARQMKAVVLMLPDGKVQSQALWIVPDPRRYLWMLGDGRFLLHERDGLSLGDDKLQIKPFLQLQGELIWLKVDPSRKILMTGTTLEKADDMAVRVVELASGRVIQTRHRQAAVEYPIDAEGELEIGHDRLDQWSLKLNLFSGGVKILGHVESTCLPNAWFISGQELLVAGCNQAHSRKLDAVSTTGQQLWETETAISYVPPLLVLSAAGTRFARETIVLNSAGKPREDTLWIKAVKGQAVRVYDAAGGKVEMETPVNPTLDAGGNAAFSPSGRRLAVLNAGAIQLFDMPPRAINEPGR
jgi:hypothetical protein